MSNTDQEETTNLLFKDKPTTASGGSGGSSKSDLENKDDDKKSVCSSNTSNSAVSVAFLNQNQRMIFKYPDGTYAYAWKCTKSKTDGGCDEWLQYKASSMQAMPSPEDLNANLSQFQVLQIEDEIEFLANNLEFLVDPQYAVDTYISNRNVLFFLIGLNLIFEALITAYIFENENFIIKQLNQIYKFWHTENFREFFQGLTTINAAYNAFVYVYGIYTVFSHKVTNYQNFTMLLMISIFLGILLTYLNVLNILLFIMKCFTYVYSRYVLSQLYTVLMVPAAQQERQLDIQQIQRQIREEQQYSDEVFSRRSNHYVPDALPFEAGSESEVLSNVANVRFLNRATNVNI